MAAMAYVKGVIAAEQYHGNIAREHFASMFKKTANPRGKLFQQDGDP